MTVKQSRHSSAPYTEGQVRKWLSWLARSMQSQEQSVFQIERLQPTWLPTRRQQRWYVLLSMLASGFFVGFFLGFFLGFFQALANGMGSLLSFSLIMAVFVGFLFGGCVALTHLFWFELSSRGMIPERWSFLRRLIIFNGLSILAFSLVYLSASGLLLLLIPEIKNSFSSLGIPASGIWLSSLPAAALMGILYGALFGRRAVRERQYGLIETAERLGWSWSAVVDGIPRGLLPGSLIGFWIGFLLSLITLFGPGVEISLEWKLLTAAFLILGTGIIGLICGGLTSAIFGGLVKKMSAMKTRPNQGIRLTFRNAFVGGSLTAVFVTLALTLVFLGFIQLNPSFEESREATFLSSLFTALALGLMGGAAAGLLGLMWYGGTDLIRHYTLRWLLYRKGRMPWRYARFLDYAAEELHFLQKVGGGYIFLHRFLLEHFAAIDKEKSKEPL